MNAASAATGAMSGARATSASRFATASPDAHADFASVLDSGIPASDLGKGPSPRAAGACGSASKATDAMLDVATDADKCGASINNEKQLTLPCAFMTPAAPMVAQGQPPAEDSAPQRFGQSSKVAHAMPAASALRGLSDNSSLLQIGDSATGGLPHRTIAVAKQEYPSSDVSTELEQRYDAPVMRVSLQTHHAPIVASPAMQITEASITVLSDAPASPAAATATLQTPPPDTTDAAVEKVRLVVLDLEPEHHGSVQVRLRLIGDELRIGVVVQKHATAALIDADRAALTDRLFDAGYRLTALDVAPAAPTAHEHRLPSDDAAANHDGSPTSNPYRQTGRRDRGSDRHHAQDDKPVAYRTDGLRL